MSVGQAAPSRQMAYNADWRDFAPLVGAVLAAVAYVAGARLGLAFTIEPAPVAVLWPPNAILLAALLLARTRNWPLILLAVLPVHLAIELRAGVPLPMVLSWYVSNCAEALIGAGIVRRLLGGDARLDSTRSYLAFFVGAVLVGTVVSSFIDAGFVAWNRFGGEGFWLVWRTRLGSNMLATLTIVPLVLACDRGLLHALRAATARRYAEGASLAVALLITCILAFIEPFGAQELGPALLYAPLPLLLWAAVRFGVFGATSSLLAVTLVAIRGSMDGRGPFSSLPPVHNVLAVQLFLFLVAPPLTMLAVVIEERTRAQREIRNSERLLGLAIAGAKIGIWALDLNTGEVTSDGTIASSFGMSPDEAGRSADWVALMLPEDQVLSTELFRLAMSPDAPRDKNGDTPLPEYVQRMRTSDGSLRWVLSRGVVLRQEDGAAHRATGIAIDITERELAAMAQREADERMALAASVARIGFWSFELETNTLWLSEHCFALLELDPAVHDARHAFEQLLAYAAETPGRALLASLRARGLTEHEFAIPQADGPERWLAVSTSQVRGRNDDSTLIVGVVRDVTAEHRAKEELRRRQEEVAHLARVAMIGDMSATVVHEIGQPLGAISLNAAAALRQLDLADVSRDEVRETLRDIERDSRRAAGVTGQLRHMLRRDDSVRESLDVQQLIREVVELARNELVVSHIDVSLGFDTEPVAVVGNKSQLQQVLLNLILNARDAMSDVAPGLRHLRVSVTRSDDGRVRVSLADSGTGIATNRIAHVFEPYFTSKDQGLGLGLAISRTIVVEHGGDLRAENGKVGAVMHLSLPEAPSSLSL